MKNMTSASGELVATVLQHGGGRQPIRWRVDWAPKAVQMGAPAMPPACVSREAALRYAVLWGDAAGLGPCKIS